MQLKGLRVWLIAAGLLLLGSATLLCGSTGFGLPDLSTATGKAVLQLRLLRLAGGMITGAALAAAGCGMQSVLHNPLAEPYILGISSGASLGVAVVIFTTTATLSPLLLPLGGFTD